MKEFKVQESYFHVDGQVAEGFESVGEAFVHHFRLGQDTNAQCCVYVGGKVVVDIWGTSREARTPEYDGDSIQVCIHFNTAFNYGTILVQY